MRWAGNDRRRFHRDRRNKGVIKYEHNVNILDISQTILQDYFTMVMLVDAGNCDMPFADLAALMEQEGKDRDLSIRAQREDIFNAMHRI